jgi:hypothetical protein
VEYIHTNPLEIFNHVLFVKAYPKHDSGLWWSLDKLVVHGFHIHAGIDGASHYVLRAKVTLDKRKEIIFEGYASIVQSLVLMCESNQILLLNTFLSKNTMLNLQGLG